MKKYPFILSLSIIVVACNTSTKSNESDNQEDNSPEAVEKALYKEVISIHDEIMPKIQTISNLKGQVESKIEGFEKEGRAGEVLTTLRNQLVELDEADKSMMEWMHNFETTYDGWTHEEIMEYLQKEKVSIQKTGEVVDSSISNTRLLLEGS